VVGVGGSERLRTSAEWELSFLACNESFSFFFFLRKPRVGIQDDQTVVEKGGRRLVASSNPFVRVEWARVSVWFKQTQVVSSAENVKGGVAGGDGL
jgi:hypothetical protein